SPNNRHPSRHQAHYRAHRHPQKLIPAAFIYLVLKPRVELIAGLAGLVPHALRTLRDDPSTPWKRIVASHATSWWHSPEEFRDLLLNNLAVITCWAAMGWWLGAGTFWLI
ncbi:MAG: fatty acid desaturase, partial [Cyanobium sp.]